MSPTGASGGPRPRDRSALLAYVGPHKAKIYTMVRTILDDLEAVAPWDGLYYPPTGTVEFLGMETALVGMIQDIPQRVAALTQDLGQADLDDATREVVDNMEFYFQGIQVSVSSELDKLSSKLEELEAGEALRSLSFYERAFICEISADLKGKYTSSIMGAAASLIAEGVCGGVEIEPILFPEKAEEFARNEQLVEALSEVTETIGNFLDQVPIVEVIQSWEQQRRVDQYALAPFYLLLGNLGKLMQVSSRRALYSGDYHQIQQRESQLSTRINQLLTLHNSTWRVEPKSEDEDAAATYAAMARIATELATILDVEILRKIVGQNQVKDLHFIVTMEKEDEAAGRVDEARLQSRRERVPESNRDLVPLLYDEDLKTFLELLLGSVLKRASLAVKRDTQLPVAELADMIDEPSAEVVAPLDPTTRPTADDPTGVPGIDPTMADPFLMGTSLEPPMLDAPSLERPALTDFSLQAPTLDESPLAGLTVDGEPLEDLESLTLDAPALEDLPPGYRSAQPSQGQDLYPPSFDAVAPAAEAYASGFENPSLGSMDSSLDATAMSIHRRSANPLTSRLESLQSLNLVLQPLLSRSSSQRKSFELVRRLLKQKRAIPGGLLQSMRPYLQEISNELIPRLRRDERLEDMLVSYGAELGEHCQILCDPQLSPETPGIDLPASMEQVLDLLNHLAIATRSTIERLSSEIETPPETDPLGW